MGKLGYPWIEDEAHPLWSAQQAGWPDHTPEQAMRAAVEHKNGKLGGRSDSAQHPAFAAGYVKNDQAEREAAEAAPAEVNESESNRR